jgi:hypothetical protein
MVSVVIHSANRHIDARSRSFKIEMGSDIEIRCLQEGAAAQVGQIHTASGRDQLLRTVSENANAVARHVTQYPHSQRFHAPTCVFQALADTRLLARRVHPRKVRSAIRSLSEIIRRWPPRISIRHSGAAAVGASPSPAGFDETGGRASGWRRTPNHAVGVAWDRRKNQSTWHASPIRCSAALRESGGRPDLSRIFRNRRE